MQRRKLTFKTVRSNLEDDQRLVGHFNYIVIQQMNYKIFCILFYGTSGQHLIYITLIKVIWSQDTDKESYSRT